MAGLVQSLHVSASGMKVQGDRMRVIAENIANAETTGQSAGSDPYRRKTISFKTVFDKEIGAEVVKIHKYGEDDSSFNARFMPGHPAANAEGYVLMPNVKSTMEVVDMRQAQRSYEANLSAVETSKRMLAKTLGLLE